MLGHNSNCMALALAPDGNTVATGAPDGILLWDLASRRVVHRLEGLGSGPDVLEYLDGGTRLYAIREDGTSALWDLTGAKPTQIPLRR